MVFGPLVTFMWQPVRILIKEYLKVPKFEVYVFKIQTLSAAA